MSYTLKILLFSSLLCFAFQCSSEPGHAGLITYVSGDVFINRIDQPQEKETAVNLGQKVVYDNQIRTALKSSAELQLKTYGLLRIGEQTTFRINEILKNQRVEIIIDEGKAGLFIDKLDKDQEIFVSTPTVVAAVRGTKFLITNDANDSSKLALFEGAVAMKNDGQDLLLDQQGEIKVKKGQKIDASMIEPLSPESLAEMKALEEMGNLDKQSDMQKPRVPAAIKKPKVP